MKRAVIIVTDALRVTYDELTPGRDGVRPLTTVDTSERVFADLRMALKLMEGHRGHGYRPEDIASAMARLRDALWDAP